MKSLIGKGCSAPRAEWSLWITPQTSLLLGIARNNLGQHRIDREELSTASPIVKRSIVVAGHKTSVSLEEAFWNGMKEISGLRSMTLSELVREIDSNRQQGNLSSAIRLFVLDYFKNRAAASQKSVSAPAGVRF